MLGVKPTDVRTPFGLSHLGLTLTVRDVDALVAKKEIIILIICIIILLYSLPLPAGVLGWGLGVVGVEVVRLMAGAVWAGLHRLGVHHTHSADLR